MSYNEPGIKEDILEAAQSVLDRVGVWAAKWVAFLWAAFLGAAVAYDLGESMYHALPTGITWAELPSIVTPRVAVAAVFGLLCLHVFANWALSFASRVERYLTGGRV